jgi:hypothetical protein
VKHSTWCWLASLDIVQLSVRNSVLTYEMIPRRLRGFVKKKRWLRRLVVNAADSAIPNSFPPGDLEYVKGPIPASKEALSSLRSVERGYVRSFVREWRGKKVVRLSPVYAVDRNPPPAPARIEWSGARKGSFLWIRGVRDWYLRGVWEREWGGCSSRPRIPPITTRDGVKFTRRFVELDLVDTMTYTPDGPKWVSWSRDFVRSGRFFPPPPEPTPSPRFRREEDVPLTTFSHSSGIYESEPYRALLLRAQSWSGHRAWLSAPRFV